MFSDLLRCADCGSKLWYHTNTINKNIHYFSCSNYVKDYRGTCETRHYIRADAVEQIVMLELGRLASYLRHDEEGFAALLAQKTNQEMIAERKQAEADLIKQQKEAEAEKYRALQAAEAKKAEAEALRYMMEQEAAGIRAKGLAEAEAIEKKAEAQKKMGEASVLEMYLTALPEVVKNAASPLSQTDRIVMYGDGNTTKLVRDVMNSTDQVIEGVKQATGIDLASIIAGFAGGKAAVAAKTETEE
jgi:flotillin